MFGLYTTHSRLLEEMERSDKWMQRAFELQKERDDAIGKLNKMRSQWVAITDLMECFDWLKSDDFKNKAQTMESIQRRINEA